MKATIIRHRAIVACLALLCALAFGTQVAFADEQTPSSAPSEQAQQTLLVEEAQSACEDDPLTADPVTVVRRADEKAVAQIVAVEDPALTEEPADEASEEPLGAMGTISTIDMYRMYNPNSGEHFYTGEWKERSQLIEEGWSFEGIGWVAPDYSLSPVYRLYNPVAGDHHYTLSTDERDDLIDEGWNDEGIGWYSDDSERIAVLRQYNPNARTGAHNFTTSENEDVSLVGKGWSAEGIGWYAIEGGNDALLMSCIYLDAGHGKGSSAKDAYDPGASGNGYEEAKLTAELVKLTAKYAKELYDLKVYSNVGTNVEYWNRQMDALDRGCTSLVSIHFNASEGGATGSESFIHSRNAAAGASQLQSIMHKALIEGMGLRDRGKKSAALAVCSGLGTNLPGTLLEICFIDNSYDMKKYQERKDTVARELAAGLYEAAKAGF